MPLFRFHVSFSQCTPPFRDLQPSVVEPTLNLSRGQVRIMRSPATTPLEHCQRLGPGLSSRNPNRACYSFFLRCEKASHPRALREQTLATLQKHRLGVPAPLGASLVLGGSCRKADKSNIPGVNTDSNAIALVRSSTRRKDIHHNNNDLVHNRRNKESYRG